MAYHRVRIALNPYPAGMSLDRYWQGVRRWEPNAIIPCEWNNIMWIILRHSRKRNCACVCLCIKLQAQAHIPALGPVNFDSLDGIHGFMLVKDNKSISIQLWIKWFTNVYLHGTFQMLFLQFNCNSVSWIFYLLLIHSNS